jgi:hypothetical protein
VEQSERAAFEYFVFGSIMGSATIDLAALTASCGKKKQVQWRASFLVAVARIASVYRTNQPDRLQKPEDAIVRLSRSIMLGSLCAITLSGCAVIENMDVDGRTSRSFVIAQPVGPPSDSQGSGHVLKITGLGITATNAGWTLGFFNSSEIALDPRCQVVLIGNTEDQVKRISAIMGKMQGVCTD